MAKTTKTTTATETPSVLRNAMLFSLTRRAWSNHIRADKAKVETTADKKNLNLTKRLLNSPELDKVTDHLNETYDWCLARAMPSTALRRGIYLVKRDMVAAFEAYLTAAERRLKDELIPAFLGTYDECQLEMAMAKEQGGLGDLYDEKDYPTKDEIPGMFGIEWAWLALSVPNELPEEVRARETTKLRESYSRAQEEIVAALRTGFKQLVDHAVERLTPDADGKQKILRGTFVSNFQAFFETFNARDLMDDRELAAVVEQARQILGSTDVETLRKEVKVREELAARFSEVLPVLDNLVTTRPGRRFALDE
jgi:hypothetical protein